MYAGKWHQAESSLYLSSSWKMSLKEELEADVFQSQTRESHPVPVKPPVLDCTQMWTCFQVEPKFIITSSATTKYLSWPMSGGQSWLDCSEKDPKPIFCRML